VAVIRGCREAGDPRNLPRNAEGYDLSGQDR